MQNSSLVNPLIQNPASFLSTPAKGLQDKVRVAQSSAGEKQKDELRKVSQQFEAVFISQMLKVMRETIEESGEGGFGKSIYTELFDQEIAVSMARRGALGISDMVYKSLVEKIADSAPSSKETAPANPTPVQTPSVIPESPVKPDPEISDMQLPVQAPVSSAFGLRKDPFSRQLRFHKGLDLAAPEGMKVVAALQGTVVFAGYENGYGNTILVQHAGGLQTRYAHLGSLQVKAGDRVDSEAVLGTVGTTGRSTGPHLHFEVTRMGDPVNPLTVAHSRAVSSNQLTSDSKTGS